LEQLNKELCEKRFNFLIHEIPEDMNNRWENRSTTLALYQKFLRESLKITEDLKLIDIHRLSQTPM